MSERTITIDISNNALEKGEVREGKQLIAWDCIQQCNTERCPIRLTCQYLKANEKCQLQVEYLNALTKTLFDTYRYMSDDMMFKIGMNLVPLYSQLCRQKIVEKSVQALTYEDAKGVTRIHPIYKEIRETMKTISMIWKDIGFTATPNPDLPVAGKPGFGNPGHYAAISANSDNKRNITR